MQAKISRQEITTETLIAAMVHTTSEAVKSLEQSQQECAERVVESLEESTTVGSVNNSFLCMSVLSASRIIQLGFEGKHQEAKDLFNGMLSRFADFDEDTIKCDGIQAESL